MYIGLLIVFKNYRKTITFRFVFSFFSIIWVFRFKVNLFYSEIVLPHKSWGGGGVGLNLCMTIVNEGSLTVAKDCQ